MSPYGHTRRGVRGQRVQEAVNWRWAPAHRHRCHHAAGRAWFARGRRGTGSCSGGSRWNAALAPAQRPPGLVARGWVLNRCCRATLCGWRSWRVRTALRGWRDGQHGIGSRDGTQLRRIVAHLLVLAADPAGPLQQTQQVIQVSGLGTVHRRQTLTILIWVPSYQGD